MNCPKFIWSLVAAFSFIAADAWGQRVANYDPGNEVFVREVKIIDEFIDRFNGHDTGFVRKMRAQNKQYVLTRDRMLMSLFNMESVSFADTTIKDFFLQVLNRQHPAFISFNDPDWYAEAAGVFLENGKLVEIPMILHIQSKGDEWAKWMITGIGPTVQFQGSMPSVSVKPFKSTATFISTSAYATDFVELHSVLGSGMNTTDFFEPITITSETGRQFIDMIKKGQLRFQYVRKITFHFYQVSNWVFTVERFSRKSLNNGWLISSLSKVTPQQKEERKRKLLNW